MQGLGKMVNQIEKFKKTCQNDSAELMEECERMEKEKRRLEYQVQVSERHRLYQCSNPLYRKGTTPKHFVGSAYQLHGYCRGEKLGKAE